MNRDLKNLKIDPSNIKNRVKSTLNANLLERRMYMKYKIQKIAAIAASFAVLSAASAFAITPTGQAAIENIMSYFQDKRAVELTSYEELAKYNEEIGVSDSKYGYTLTLDNVAADDNFVHVFFTLKSDETPFYKDDPNNILGIARDFWEECKINGEYADVFNHNEEEGYFADPNTYKCVKKYNVSGMNIPDNFNLEFFMTYAPDYESTEDIRNFAENNGKALKLSVSADIDKSKVKVNTVTKELNLPLWNEHTIAEKLIFSPFGNQLVIKATADNADEDTVADAGFALFDENGTALDILNTDLNGSGEDGVSTNSFEFLKADANTKKLTFVPLKSKIKQGNSDVMFGEECERKKIGAYPLEFQLSEYGKVVVTDVRITDGRIEIDYYNDGFILYDPEFAILDDTDNDHAMLARDDIRCLYDVKVNHANNSYTATYQYYYYDENDKEVSASAECNAEFLRKSCTQLSLYKQDYLLLDYDNAITVDIK